MKLRASIERDLPAFVIGLLAAVVLAMSLLTYREIGRFAESAASSRLLEHSKNWAELFSLDVPRRLGLLRTAAADPVLRSALESADTGALDRAVEVMKPRAVGPVFAIELRDAANSLVVSTAAGSDEVLPEQPPHDEYGPLYAGAEGRACFDIRVPVMAGDAVIGALVERRHAVADEQGRRALRGLLGAETELLLGNASGDLWTDLSALVDGPPVDALEDMHQSAFEFDSKGVARLGAAAHVAHTPWVLVVDLPRAAVYQPVRKSLLRIGLIAGSTMILGVGSAWFLSRRLTMPLKELTGGVGAIAAGDLERRVHVGRDDELGQLAAAFNAMADRVAQARLNLESKVEDRTRELRDANAELARKELKLTALYERLRELDRLKTEFFANVSHELRTPLALILGPIESCLGSPDLSTAQRRNLEVAQRNARLLLKDVGDLLDVAKLEVGKMVLHYAEVDLAPLVRRTASNFDQLADERRCTFELESPESLAVHADPDKIQRILVNLLSNAFKFTPAGGRVRCILERGESTARIVVSDDGPGVPEHLREAVFDRFFQVEGHAPLPLLGTGLGLSIVKEFVTLHGGMVRVDEASGGGARFTVELPLSAPPGTSVSTSGATPGDELARDAAMELRTVPQASPTAGSPEAPGAPLVLVVEDNAAMNAFLAETLSEGCRVVRAHDGVEGLEKAVALRPDLIVCDLMLPKLGGDRVVDEVRLRREMDSIPILLLTARADDEIHAELLNRGAQDCLVKPFHRRELQARAAGLIGRKRRTEERILEQQRLLLAVTEGLAEGVFVKDREGRYIMANSAAARMFGKEVSEIIGKTDKELLSAGWERAAEKYDRQVVLQGGSQTYEITLGTGSAQRSYMVTKGPYRDDQVIIGTTGILRDITGIKQADDSLRLANESLRRSNEDLNQFTYAASHDLQEPLRMVSTFTQLLHNKVLGKIDSEVDEFLGIIVESATRMSTMLRDILSYSKATMLSDAPTQPVEVSVALSKAILNLELAAIETNAKITYDPMPSIPVQESHLIQIFQNLIGNSLKYRNSSAPVVHVSVEHTEKEWIFAVSDNGIGIDARYKEQIFGLFRRLHGRKYAGTGIGLATCDRIVKRYGGRIWVDSVPGMGSTFRFSFPRQE